MTWFLQSIGAPTCGDAVIEQFSTAPSATREAQIQSAASQLCSGILSGNDISAKLDMFQVYAAETEQQAKVDWITLTEQVTYADAPTFTADVGYSTDGSNDAVLTGFNPGDGGSYNYTQNSASFGLWRNTSAAISSSNAFSYDGSSGSTLTARGNLDDYIWRINQATSSNSGDTSPSPTGEGLATVVRTGASATVSYFHGRTIPTLVDGNQASVAVPNQEWRVGSLSASLFSTGSYAAAFAGEQLSDAEQADINNALAGYMVGTALGETVSISKSGLHAVRNAWAPNGDHIVCSGPDKVYRSEDGGRSYQLIFTMPDSPERIYGLFIASNGYIFVSSDTHGTGIKGRTYRSTDGGDNFTQITTFDASYHSGNIAFWSMCEDTSNGDLYVGQYELDTVKPTVCKVFKSTDDGANWTDISDASWSTNDHIHGVGIDAASGWLYATLGDTTGGIWRSKLKDGTDWVAKTSTSVKWIPLVFDGTYVYTADDEALGTVARFQDDGTSGTQSLTTLLDDPDTHNVYYLARDNNGRFWCSMPPADASNPTNTQGAVYISDDGTTWHRIFTMPKITYSTWNTGGGSGDDSSEWQLHTGTTQFGSNNECLFPGYSSNGLKFSIS